MYSKVLPPRRGEVCYDGCKGDAMDYRTFITNKLMEAKGITLGYFDKEG